MHNYIHDFLQKTGQENIALEYDLMPFKITTKSIYRTFADKVFTICDYYMDGKIDSRSRYLYDIHKIYSSQTFLIDKSVKKLIEEVRRAREA